MTDDTMPHAGDPGAGTGASESPFVMKLSLSVLDDLGVNLYSNTAAVLSEAVANAWDADAEEVRVTIGDDEIEIIDNGTGMGTVKQINERYLTVGYKRVSTVVW